MAHRREGSTGVTAEWTGCRTAAMAVPFFNFRIFNNFSIFFKKTIIIFDFWLRSHGADVGAGDVDHVLHHRGHPLLLQQRHCYDTVGASHGARPAPRPHRVLRIFKFQNHSFFFTNVNFSKITIFWEKKNVFVGSRYIPPPQPPIGQTHDYPQGITKIENMLILN